MQAEGQLVNHIGTQQPFDYEFPYTMKCGLVVYTPVLLYHCVVMGNKHDRSTTMPCRPCLGLQKAGSTRRGA